jgi:hypothetical protein
MMRCRIQFGDTADFKSALQAVLQKESLTLCRVEPKEPVIILLFIGSPMQRQRVNRLAVPPWEIDSGQMSLDFRRVGQAERLGQFEGFAGNDAVPNTIRRYSRLQVCATNCTPERIPHFSARRTRGTSNNPSFHWLSNATAARQSTCRSTMGNRFRANVPRLSSCWSG